MLTLALVAESQAKEKPSSERVVGDAQQLDEDGEDECRLH
jgi:hypothetical protein